MSHYLIEQLAGIDERARAHLHDGRRGARHRPPGGGHAAGRADRGADDATRPATCSSSSAARRAPTGSTASVVRDERGFIPTGPGPARGRPPAARLAAGPRPVLPGVQPARGVRRRRRAGGVGEAGRLGRRRGRHGGDPRAPLPGGAMTTTDRAADARTSCASCSSSRTSTPSSWTGCRPTATSSSARPARTSSVEGEPAECFYVLLAGTMTHGPARRRHRGRDRADVGTAACTPARSSSTSATGSSSATRRRSARSPTAGSSPCPRSRSPRCSGGGTRWRSTCWRGCSSASATSPSWSGSGSGCSRSGKLTAGLTHELNNPAAAAARADGGAARAVRRHAAQAGDAVRGQARRRGAALAHRAAGGVRRAHRRRRGTSRRWSARTARTRSASGSRSTT